MKYNFIYYDGNGKAVEELVDLKYGITKKEIDFNLLLWLKEKVLATWEISEDETEGCY